MLVGDAECTAHSGTAVKERGCRDLLGAVVVDVTLAIPGLRDSLFLLFRWLWLCVAATAFIAVLFRMRDAQDWW